MPMLTTLRMGRPVWPFQRPLADVVGEGRHAVEHRVHLGHDVHAVHHDPLARRRPQGDVKHGPLLGHVDLLAAEHGLDASGEAALVGQPQQQPERLVGDAMLRVVEVEAGGLGGQALARAGVVGEDLPQVQLADLCRSAAPAPSTPGAR